MPIKAYNVLQSHQTFPLHAQAMPSSLNSSRGTQQYGNNPRPCLPSMALGMTFCQALTVSTELTTVERPHLPWQGTRHEALSSTDSEHCRGSTVGSCGSCLHGSNLLLGGKTALDAGAYFCIRFSALIPDRLLKSAPLPLLTIPAHIAHVVSKAPMHSRCCYVSRDRGNTDPLPATCHSASFGSASNHIMHGGYCSAED